MFDGVPLMISPEASPSSMRAIVHRAYGNAGVLQQAELDLPVPGHDEVLVRVHAAGLDRGTWHMMTGEPRIARLALGLRRPKQLVPGLDLAGVVVAVGSNVTRFRPGDEVFGIGQGTFAEYCVARGDKLAAKPADLSFAQAAAVPISGLTALQAVVDAGRLQPGQRVLILGASGGVGSFAVQIARSAGGHVTGVCRTDKIDLVRELGANDVVDYRTSDPLAVTEPYDLIVDIGGGRPLGRLRQALTRQGTLVIVGSETGDRWLGIGRQLRATAINPFVSQRLVMLISSENGADLERLRRLIEEGEVRPIVERTFPLAEAPAAMRHLAAGEARGKLVIVPGQG
jgi:NADPH:quinone reductase-like Zn-dependent oxidoreductase